MSVSGISGSGFLSGLSSSLVHNKFRQLQQEFSLLGKDLQSSNIKQAQSDFSALQQDLSKQQSTSSTTLASNPLSQAVAQLGQDLQSGNLKAAQSDFATLQQDIQQLQGTRQATHHHHHHHAESAQSSQSSNSGPRSAVASLFTQLGQELQAGNVTQAQRTYATLQQDFQQFTANNGVGSAGTPGTSGSGLSITA
jgi:hypothetical protein